MSKREIASLALKLMGIWLLIKSLAMVPFTIGNLISVRESIDGFDWPLLYIGFSWAVSIGLPLLIIVFSDKCAGWLIRDDKTVEWNGSVQKSDVFVVAFAIIGLFLVVTGIPTFIVQLTQMQVRSHYSQSGGVSQAAYLIAPVVQIALGVWLFAGSRGIVKLWERIRT